MDLVRMIGPRGPNDIAVVRPEWVAEWRGYGYAVADVPADPAPNLDLTPEGIDAMDKETLADLLAAHGVAADKRRSREALADALKAVVFI